MVFKFLGKGKKSEYFLEAPPATNGSEPVAKVANKVAEVTEQISSKVAEAADKVADKVAGTKSAAPEPLKAIAEAASKPELVANGATPETAKTKKLKKSKSTEAKETTASAGASSAATPNTAKLAPQPESVKNFATEHLMPATTPRRRPGPSMDGFRTMAKDVTPRK